MSGAPRGRCSPLLWHRRPPPLGAWRAPAGTRAQPCDVPRSLLVSEEMRSLIVEKGPGPVEEDPDALVKGRRRATGWFFSAQSPGSQLGLAGLCPDGLDATLGWHKAGDTGIQRGGWCWWQGLRLLLPRLAAAGGAGRRQDPLDPASEVLVRADPRLPGLLQQQREGSQAPGLPRAHQPLLRALAGQADLQGDG